MGVRLEIRELLRHPFRLELAAVVVVEHVDHVCDRVRLRNRWLASDTAAWMESSG
jgi:hypothetical protein